MSQVYINGDFVASEQATVSVFDRAFLFADAVYEVIPAYQGKLFQLKRHIARLHNSMHEIGMQFDHSVEFWGAIFQSILEKNGGGTQAIYLQVSRAGHFGQRSHSFNQLNDITLVGFPMPLPPADKKVTPSGMKVIVHHDIRWKRCDIKATSLLANLLMLNAAQQQGADDAIIIRNGNAVEATSSNLFMVRDSIVYTPPLSHDLLAGVTRDFIIQLLKDKNIAVVEKNISQEELFSADEIWLTSSTKEIAPVIEIGGQKVAKGKIGPIWETVAQAYFDFKQRLYFDPTLLDQLKSAPDSNS